MRGGEKETKAMCKKGAYVRYSILPLLLHGCVTNNQGFGIDWNAPRLAQVSNQGPHYRNKECQKACKRHFPRFHMNKLHKEPPLESCIWHCASKTAVHAGRVSSGCNIGIVCQKWRGLHISIIAYPSVFLLCICGFSLSISCSCFRLLPVIGGIGHHGVR